MSVPSLVAITPGDHGRGVDRWPWLRLLARAGVRTVLIREPHLSDDDLDALVLNCWGSFPEVVVHDRHPRARQYHGPIHLPAHGRADGYPGGWSRSCHDAPEVDAALAEGARWVTLSPVWPPTSKPDDDRPALGLDRFLAIRAVRPVLALGGVTVERARTLGAHGVGFAVCGAIFGQPDPEAGAAAGARLLAAWRDAGA